MKTKASFTIRKLLIREHDVRYETFLVEGYLHGRCVRKKFKREEEAVGEQSRSLVVSGNADVALWSTTTRLTDGQADRHAPLPGVIIRRFDPNTFKIHFLDDSLDLAECFKEMTRVDEAAKAARSSVRAYQPLLNAVLGATPAP